MSFKARLFSREMSGEKKIFPTKYCTLNKQINFFNVRVCGCSGDWVDKRKNDAIFHKFVVYTAAFEVLPLGE